MKQTKHKKLNKGVSVIIPTFNRVAFLYPTLICLLNQNIKINIFYEIIIIDSGDDETEELINSLKKSTNVVIIYKKIKRSSNRSLIRNIGVDFSNYSIICFLDNDMLVSSDFIVNHYNEHMKETHLIVLGKRVSLLDYNFSKLGEEQLIEDYDNLSNLPAYYDEREKYCITIQPWRFVFTHSFSIEKEDFYKAGKFNANFGNNWGYEDLELGFRLQMLGYSFKLLDNSISYHQPHFIQSLKDQYSKNENSKLFFKLHNCFEVELYIALYTNFEEHFSTLQKLQAECYIPKKELLKKFDLIFGCIIPSSHNLSYNKMQLGCFSIYEDNQINSIYVLPLFNSFSTPLQVSILSEAFRISKIVCFSNLNQNQDKIINSICTKIGYNILMEKKGNYSFFHKIGNFDSKIYSVFLPDLLQPEKRYVYLWLAHFLHSNDCLITVLDGKKITSFDNEDFSVSNKVLTNLKQCIECSYGYVKYRYIASCDMILTDEEKVFPKNMQTIVLHDENFELKSNQLKNRLLQQYLSYDKNIYSILSLLSIYDDVIEYKKKINKLNIIKEYSFCTFMENGYKEDGIDILLSVFATVVKNNPKITLSIKIPNYRLQIINSYPQHNKESKNNKNFYILQKYNLDNYLLLDEIQKLNLQHNVTVIEDNYSIDKVIEYISKHQCLIQIGRICSVPPQVYISILLRKKVIIPNHQNESLVSDLRPYCKYVQSKVSCFYEEMNLPNNCVYNRFLAYQIDKVSLCKFIIDPSDISSIQIEVELEELIKKYKNYIKSLF